MAYKAMWKVGKLRYEVGCTCEVGYTRLKKLFGPPCGISEKHAEDSTVQPQSTVTWS